MCGSGCMSDDKESMKCKKGEILLFIRVNGITLNGALGVFVVHFFIGVKWLVFCCGTSLFIIFLVFEQYTKFILTDITNIVKK